MTTAKTARSRPLNLFKPHRTQPLRMVNFALQSTQAWAVKSLSLHTHGYPFRYTKIHGLPRCGTNYVAKLMQQNLRTMVMEPTETGWKHGPCEYEPYTDYIFVTKNPYSWLLSFKHWEEIHERTETIALSDFLTSPVSHPQLQTAWQAETFVDAWNKASAAWLQYRDKPNVLFMRYEAVLEDFSAELKNVREAFGYRMRTNEFSNISKRVDDWKTKKPRKPLNVQYYQNEEFMAEFSPQDLQTIRDSIDADLADSLGYKIY